MRCPRCGAETDHKVIVDLDLNTIASSLGSAKLTPIQTEIVYVLINHMPNVISVDSLITAVWGDTKPINVKSSLQVNLHKIRKTIKPLGLEIVTARARGFMIHENYH